MSVVIGSIVVSFITFVLFNAIKALNDYDSSLSNSVSVCIIFVLVILSVKGVIS